MLSWLILAFAVPLGFFISWVARDELKQGRTWFRRLATFSILGLIGSWLYGSGVLAFSFAFIAILSLTSFIKGNDPGWTKA